jgi:hypothetical protein
MRIPVVIISAASLVALGGLAQADDHLFQAVTEGGLGGPATEHTQALNHDSPGRGSPFTSFSDELGTPSVGVDRLNEKAQDNVPFGEEEE